MKRLHLPAVRWSDRFDQWFVRIGYRRSKSGIRQRAFKYLGEHGGESAMPPAAAIAVAVALKMEWRELKRSNGRHAVWSDAQTIKRDTDRQADVDRVLAEAAKDHPDLDAIDLSTSAAILSEPYYLPHREA